MADKKAECKQIFELLSDYLDLDLPPDACHDIDEHLAGCPPCVEFAESLRQTVDLCKKYRPSDLPAPLGRQAREDLLRAYRTMLEARKGTARAES